ncbi:ABC transporter substrate-binding protein [Telmatospirillum siberiense]|uniref:SsuA/THI5-like domain-containing protein n=1 Tax=Telmatospirillum siberiense TaxID=382514 RepID=A0A2N3PPU2_9PROT|nr:ABC transporter substrate-binding protein [Telmatospirillum siberiense]PKU22415.1 hypothetical protein CWS72_21680 [Telmatospirillum siberiense]
MTSRNRPALSPSAGLSIDRRSALGHLGRLGIGAVSLGGFLRFAAGPAAAETPTPVSHQLGWLKGVQFGGDFMAQEQGYFAEEKLDVHYNAGGPGTDYRTLVASGRTLVSESNALGIIEGARQGQPIVAFAAVMQRDPGCFLSPASAPITSLQDMVGKTIGLPNNIRAQVQVLLKRADIDARKIKFVPVGTDPGMLMAKQVDAYWGWATTAATALRLAGLDPYILYTSDLGIADYGQVLIARRDSIEQNGDTFVRYTRALIKGWRWMVDHPAETAKIVVEKYAQPGTDLARQTTEAEEMKSYVLHGDALTQGLLWIKPEVFENALKLAQDAGTVASTQSIDISRIVTQSIIKAALGKS